MSVNGVERKWVHHVPVCLPPTVLLGLLRVSVDEAMFSEELWNVFNLVFRVGRVVAVGELVRASHYGAAASAVAPNTGLVGQHEAAGSMIKGKEGGR
jgi:hypothetical protein